MTRGQTGVKPGSDEGQTGVRALPSAVSCDSFSDSGRNPLSGRLSHALDPGLNPLSLPPFDPGLRRSSFQLQVLARPLAVGEGDLRAPGTSWLRNSGSLAVAGSYSVSAQQ